MRVPPVGEISDLKAVIDAFEEMRGNIEDHVVGSYASALVDAAQGMLRLCDAHMWQVDELVYGDVRVNAMRRLRPMREGLSKQRRITTPKKSQRKKSRRK